jgi:hypothetical protein
MKRTYEIVLSGGLGVADVIFEPGGGEGGRPPRTRRYLMGRTRKVASVVFAVAAFGAAATPAVADQPPGQLGYEGQPGNQGGASGNPGGGQPPGQLGYEGQPGNQGGASGNPG